MNMPAEVSKNSKQKDVEGILVPVGGDDTTS